MHVKEGGVYEHVKSRKHYRVVCVGKDADDLKEFVVYEALYDNPVSKFWIRPLENFIGHAKSPDGTTHPRFRLVS